MSECLLLMRHCLKRAFLNVQSQQSSVQSVIPSARGGGYGCFYAGYWTVISLALPKRGWREECDERVWGYLGSQRCVSVCWRAHYRLTDDPGLCADSHFVTLCINRWRCVTLSRSLDSFLFSSVSRTRSRSYSCLYSVSNSSRSLWLDGKKHTHRLTVKLVTLYKLTFIPNPQVINAKLSDFSHLSF